MRMYIATNLMGSFAFDREGKLLDKVLFRKDPEFIAGRLSIVQRGDVIPEEKLLMERLSKKGYREVFWDKKAEIKGYIFIHEDENIAKATLRDSYRKLALELGWVSSQAELNELLTKVNVALTKGRLKEQKKDRLIMQVIGVIDELDRDLNVLSERLREWYGLHFPEISRAVQSNEKLCEIISRYGKKDDIKEKELIALAEKSAGMEFTEKDTEPIKEYAHGISEMYKTKKNLSRYLESLAGETIPNLSALAGSLLASRLLVLAGGLEKIARLPSSTIQLLGSEKALFRHLRDKTRAPKYGILFGHPYVQKAPKDRKGKAARIVAAKLSLAARVDFFSKEDRGEKLRKELDEEIKRVLG